MVSGKVVKFFNGDLSVDIYNIPNNDDVATKFGNIIFPKRFITDSDKTFLKTLIHECMASGGDQQKKGDETDVSTDGTSDSSSINSSP